MHESCNNCSSGVRTEANDDMEKLQVDPFQTLHLFTFNNHQGKRCMQEQVRDNNSALDTTTQDTKKQQRKPNSCSAVVTAVCSDACRGIQLQAR